MGRPYTRGHPDGVTVRIVVLVKDPARQYYLLTIDPENPGLLKLPSTYPASSLGVHRASDEDLQYGNSRAGVQLQAQLCCFAQTGLSIPVNRFRVIRVKHTDDIRIVVVSARLSEQQHVALLPNLQSPYIGHIQFPFATVWLPVHIIGPELSTATLAEYRYSLSRRGDGPTGPIPQDCTDQADWSASTQ